MDGFPNTTAPSGLGLIWAPHFNIWKGCFVGRCLTAFGGLSFGSEADNDNNINDGGRIKTVLERRPQTQAS